MRRSAWAGSSPSGESEARDRLMDAAIRCVRRFGREKTSVGDIAAEARVTRPTVYAYFKDRDEILTLAQYRAAALLSGRLFEHLESFDADADRVVEALLFFLRELPADPTLGLLFSPGGLDTEGIFSARPRAFLRGALGSIVRRHRFDEAELDEIGEVLVRFLFSFLLLESPEGRDESELRALLHRRLVPALGLRPARGSRRKA
ncbi:MAG: TetR/AcrR family transcriptional regulator [Deltaproteobacteria bacterium]|nr:TetR/AcrR family transcriptional regulator [Deltaproteobacteria bacterium]